MEKTQRGPKPKDPYCNYALKQAREEAGLLGRQLAEAVGIGCPAFFPMKD